MGVGEIINEIGDRLEHPVLVEAGGARRACGDRARVRSRESRRRRRVDHRAGALSRGSRRRLPITGAVTALVGLAGAVGPGLRGGSALVVTAR